MNIISAIVPTIGRPDCLKSLLDALAAQSRRPDEVIVADGSDNPAVASLVTDQAWAARGLAITHLRVTPPNAVRQRQAAIAHARGGLLLMLDDDVVPEADCVAALLSCLEQRGAVAVGANFSNQSWPRPTMLWRCYLRIVHGLRGDEWQGKVVGPLLRFGYTPVPNAAMRMEWIGAGHTLVRRDAFEQAGGFSDFFLHRSTMNEDVDLAMKLTRIGSIYLCPHARMAHLEAPGGRVSIRDVAEDDLYNRYVILRQTAGRSRATATALVLTFFVVETLSGISASVRRWRGAGFAPRLVGRVKALSRIAAS